MVWPRFKAPLIGFWLNSFRLFWLFSKRWTTNRITLNNTQYSKLFNSRIILPRSDLDSNIHIKELDQSPNAEHIAEPFRSERMNEKSRKWSGLYENKRCKCCCLQPLADCSLVRFDDEEKIHTSSLEMKYHQGFSPAQGILWKTGKNVFDIFCLIIWQWRSYRRKECHL